MWLSVLGFIIAIIVVIVGVSKQYNFVLMSFIGSLIIALTSQMNVMEALIGPENSFVSGMGGFVADYFIIFLLSSIFAKYMEESGAAESIANFILKVVGQDDPYFVLVAVFAMGAILTIGGVSVFVALFVVVPLARNLFKRLDIPWYLLATPYFMGVGSFTMTTFPGSPQIQNIIPSQALGTPLTAAPLISLITVFVAVVWSLWRIRVELNAALERGDTFEDEETVEDVEATDAPLPHTFVSLLPLLSLLIIIIIGSFTGVENIIYYGLAVAVILSLILFHQYIPSHKEVLNPGVENSISPVILPAAAVGFGTVLSASEGFNYIVEGAQALPIPNLLTVALLTIFIVFAIGSAYYSSVTLCPSLFLLI